MSPVLTLQLLFVTGYPLVLGRVPFDIFQRVCRTQPMDPLNAHFLDPE